MTEPYYRDEQVTLYHGDCREVLAWLEADVLVMDPPYGRSWRQGVSTRGGRRQVVNASSAGIANDTDTEVRDAVLQLWAGRGPALVFGDLMLPPPAGTKLVGGYLKPADAGLRGTVAGHRRDLEALYWVGDWPDNKGTASSLYRTAAPNVGNPSGIVARSGGHPHAKPLDVLERLILGCPPGVIADPTTGSGSTLLAARNLGRRAIGVELEERYCEVIARRLAQDCLPLGETA